MDEKIEIVFFHPAAETFSGGPKMLYRLLKGLDHSRFKPILLTNSKDALVQRLSNDIQCEIVPLRGELQQFDESILDLPIYLYPKLAMSGIEYNLKVRKYLQSADIIWCEDIRTMAVILPYIGLTKTPVIWNVGLAADNSKIVEILQKISLYAADYVFIESESQAKGAFPSNYEDFNQKFVIFHKGIDTSYFTPEKLSSAKSINGIDIQKPAIGTAATLTPRKGLETLINALPAIHKRHQNVHIYIAGDTPKDSDDGYKQKLKSIVKQNELESHVHFLGWVDNMPEYLASLDVFLLPSYNEGISGAVREAMAMEVPVICTDVGGMADLINDGKNGRLVDPGDVDQVSKAITDILECEDFANRLGESGRDTIVQSYSVDNYVNNYESLFERLCE
jgi:glycosyltransferase involved in cell wall biosynthesis